MKAELIERAKSIFDSSGQSMEKRKKDFIASLKAEGINEKVIDAFSKFDQKAFFDPIFESYFYSDEQIPIGNGEKSESINSLALMLNQLNDCDQFRALEVGTGSGYSTTILSKLVNEVITVEYHEDLAINARKRLNKLKIDNVRFLTGDIKELNGIHGAFDVIIIFAACSKRPLFLFPYIKEGGIMVFPMGPLYQQQIVVLKNEPNEKDDSLYKMTFGELCKFTPLIGIY